MIRALVVTFMVGWGTCAIHAEPLVKPVTCEGAYKRHLQGVCTNQKDALYWSWTEVLVKTDLQGHVLVKREVANHHGDLCFHAGKVYVAVNLGLFNEPPGKEDSWVYVYDAQTLDELARHAVPEVVHGAGGMAVKDGRFLVVGGLPPGVPENYLYEYDAGFQFIRRHVLASGPTDKGIQTVTWAHGSWWFGCYGKPAILLRADAGFQFTGRWEYNASLGIEALSDGLLLIGTNTVDKTKAHTGRVFWARPDEEKGCVPVEASRP